MIAYVPRRDNLLYPTYTKPYNTQRKVPEMGLFFFIWAYWVSERGDTMEKKQRSTWWLTAILVGLDRKSVV